MNRLPARNIRAAVSVLVALAILPISGCNIVGGAYMVIHGPEKADARYELDPARSTVVFVDDLSNNLPSRSLRGDIATSIESELLGRGLAKDVIDHRAAMSAANKDRYGKPMSITDIGRAVGADIVIYVDITKFALSPDGVTMAPVGGAQIKVIDAKADKRLWPSADGDGEVKIQMREGQGSAPTSLSEQSAALQKLATEFGKGVAQAFYEHETNDRAGRSSAPVNGS